jgi:hypothetical protein
MKLEQALKTSLDEVRMQMLGVQVLFGFELQASFQTEFPHLSAVARSTGVVALSLIVLTLGLLIAPACQHRLVERGEDSLRVLGVVTRFANLSLIPLALAMGCGVFVVMSLYFSPTTALISALSLVLYALIVWYVLGISLRRSPPAVKVPPPSAKKSDLHGRIEQMLTEARVILPGVQALLGFQLVVGFTQAFAQLKARVQLIHLGALFAVAVSVVLLIAPAAVHRLAFHGRDDERFHSLGSRIVTVALVPLSLGLATDVYVATLQMRGNGRLALTMAILVLVLLSSLWFVIPLLLAQKHGDLQRQER